MRIFQRFKFNKILKSYIRLLPNFLSKDYGSAKTYSPDQIVKTIERYKLNNLYLRYGIVLFSDKTQYVEYYDEHQAINEFKEIRQILANKYFNGTENFNQSDIRVINQKYSKSNVNYIEGDRGGNGDGD